MGQDCAHDCILHGTTSLFAAMDIATDKVTARCRKRHSHQEQLASRRPLNKETPNDLCIHFICDDWVARKHGTAIAWVAKRRRIHLQCTPTYASWLSRGVRRSALPSQRAVQRETFRKVWRRTIDRPQVPRRRPDSPHRSGRPASRSAPQPCCGILYPGCTGAGSLPLASERPLQLPVLYPIPKVRPRLTNRIPTS